jgi:alpha-ketoglutarate-dependent taurine dioxygenase
MSLSQLTDLAQVALGCGYASTELPLSSEGLLQACRALGEPVAITDNAQVPDTIVYTGEPEAGSWRGMLPDNAYPFHSDAAFHSQPPRFLVLYCVDTETDAAGTDLIDPLPHLNAEQRRILASEPWRIVHAGRRISTRILSDDAGTPCLRWDPMAMRPFLPSSAVGRRIIENAIAQTTKISHAWSSSSLLLIDNWRMLHARPPCDDRAKRTLWRVLIR